MTTMNSMSTLSRANDEKQTTGPFLRCTQAALKLLAALAILGTAAIWPTEASAQDCSLATVPSDNPPSCSDEELADECQDILNISCRLNQAICNAVFDEEWTDVDDCVARCEGDALNAGYAENYYDVTALGCRNYVGSPPGTTGNCDIQCASRVEDVTGGGGGGGGGGNTGGLCGMATSVLMIGIFGVAIGGTRRRRRR